MSYYGKIIVHIVLMSLFLLLMASGAVYARYLKKQNRGWLNIHRKLAVTGVLSGLAGILWMAAVLQMDSGGHLRVPHAYIGLISFIAAAAAPFLGTAFVSPRFSSDSKKNLRVLHKLSGRSAIILAAAAAFAGLVFMGFISLPF